MKSYTAAVALVSVCSILALSVRKPFASRQIAGVSNFLDFADFGLFCATLGDSLVTMGHF
jgi:hypothetical protein